jgi:hypothetical protein
MAGMTMGAEEAQNTEATRTIVEIFVPTKVTAEKRRVLSHPQAPLLCSKVYREHGSRSGELIYL